MNYSVCILILLPNLLLITNLNAQHQFDLVYGIGANYWEVKLADSSIPEEQLQERIRGEWSKPEKRLGFNYHFKGKSSISLKTGLRFLVSGFRSYELMSLDESEKRQINVQEKSSQKGSKKYDYDYLFLELPIMARWIYSIKSCDAYLEAGTSLNTYVGTRIHSSKGEERDEDLNGFIREEITPFHLRLLFSSGVSTEIANTIPVFIQLVGSYQLNPLENGIWAERSFGFGLETGIRWSF